MLESEYSTTKAPPGRSLVSAAVRRAALAGLLLVLASLAAPAYTPARAAASDDDVVLKFNGLRIKYNNAVILAKPGSDHKLVFDGISDDTDVEVLECDTGGVSSCRVGDNEIWWGAPKTSGNYWIKVKLCISSGNMARSYIGERDEWVRVAALVGYPSSLIEEGKINGFELGEYPDWRNMRRKEYYKEPDWFYYLDYDYIGLNLSENVRLGDLGYDGRAPIPQYFALDYNLVKKLEVIKAELERRGLSSRYHYIGGGFISPKSNIIRTSRTRAAAKLSRHLYGEAIDFIIDEDPRDEIMDDLNQDGIVDVRDALFLKDLIQELEEKGKVVPGGTGVYAPPRNSQIQLHIDTRGYSTSWGVKKYNPEEFAGEPPVRSMRPGS